MILFSDASGFCFFNFQDDISHERARLYFSKEIDAKII